MKKLLLLMCCALSFAKNIEVSARHFKGVEKEPKTTLSKDVVVKSDDGILKCDLLVIYYDKNKQPTKYEASLNLQFDIKIKASSYEGVADKLIYIVKDDTYTMLGKVHIKDKISNKDVKANKVVFNGKTGDYIVSGNGSNEPVKLKFELGK